MGWFGRNRFFIGEVSYKGGVLRLAFKHTLYAPCAASGSRTGCDEHLYRTLRQLRCELRETIHLIVRPPILDFDCLPFDESALLQSLMKCPYKRYKRRSRAR